jgi:hypothetical protein
MTNARKIQFTNFSLLERIKLNKDTLLIAMVCAKRMETDNFLDIIVHKCNVNFLSNSVSAVDDSEIHVYYFHNISTIVREFRSIG